MKKSLNLSIIATIVIATLSMGSALAKSGQSSTLKSKNVNSVKADENVRLFVNNQQRSLYQVALLSGISITELREINKGDYDKIDVVKVGDSIILPVNSPLLPAEEKITKTEDKYSHLPSLGSSDSVDVQSNGDEIERQVATVLQTLGQQDWENMTSEKLKEDVHNQTQDYAENYVRNQVTSQVIDPIRSAAQDFLGRFGTAQLQFDVSDQGKFNNVNVKLFSPWYDSDNTLIFSQLTFQEFEKDRRIGNFGIGQRWDFGEKSWLLGYNVFLDHDFDRAHNRLGVGLEAWSDYMKFAANYYHPLSDWKDSKDFDDYLERAAKGFDVRFQGYLPSYPHLGASLMFEQYFGEKVALFGKDKLQKDPYAVTVGVDYTPVPLFTIKGEHKQGENSNKAAKVELTMNYRLGVPLKDQLDPNMVDVARSLKGSRYDLVDRNNFIVLEYKEKKFSVDLATLGEWVEGSIVPVVINVRNEKGALSPFVWNSLTGPMDLTTLNANGGDLCYNRGSVVAGTLCPVANAWPAVNSNDKSNWSVLAPNYINVITGQPNPLPGTTAIPGRYTFDVTVTDSSGATVSSNASALTVKPSSLRKVILDNISPVPGGGTDVLGSVTDPAPADGVAIVKLEARLDNNGSGFHDYNMFDYHPPLAATPPPPLLAGFTSATTTPTALDIARLNELYDARSGSTEVIFVDGNANSSCPATTPDCLLVKEIDEVTGDNNLTPLGDRYHIEVSTTAALGQVDISLKMASYDATPIKSIYFTGGAAGRIDIFDGANNLVAQDLTGSGTLTMLLGGTLAVGDTYRADAYYTSGTQIVNPDITWSLVGDNSSACPAPNNTILPDATTAPIGPWFNVASGPNSSYTMQGITTSAVSNAPYQGINVAALGGQVTIPAPGACAGDQGFKLQVTIK